MNTGNLLLIGATLWIASRFLKSSKKRPGDPAEGGVVSEGSISDVSLGQASMSAVTKNVGDTVAISIAGTVSTKKGASAIPWTYGIAYSVLGQNTGALFKADSTPPVPNVIEGPLSTQFTFVIPAAWENKVFKVVVRLVAARPNADGSPGATLDVVLAERIVDEAVTVSAQAVVSSGAISSVSVTQRGLMEMYAGR